MSNDQAFLLLFFQTFLNFLGFYFFMTKWSRIVNDLNIHYEKTTKVFLDFLYDSYQFGKVNKWDEEVDSDDEYDDDEEEYDDDEDDENETECEKDSEDDENETECEKEETECENCSEDCFPDDSSVKCNETSQ